MSFRFWIFAALVSYASLARAGSPTPYLITLPGPKPSLAKSVKKLEEGKYQFVLDTSKELKNGPVTFEVVKRSLEKRLKRKFAIEVSGDAGSMIVSFTGDEEAFLKRLSKTRIKHLRKTEIAATSSVSSAGIRALKLPRKPKPEEVKALVLNTKGQTFKAMVQEIGEKAKRLGVENRPTEFQCDQGFKPKQGQVVYMVVLKRKNELWSATGCELAQ